MLSVFKSDDAFDQSPTEIESAPLLVDTVEASKQEASWAPNGAIYLVRTSALLKTKDLSAPPTLLLSMSAEESIDIDTEDDLYRAEQLFAQTRSSLE